MQSFLSRIWTRVAVSISYDNNHYTTGAFWTNTLGKSMNLHPQSSNLGVEYNHYCFFNKDGFGIE